MANITEAQRALLTGAASEPEGVIDAPQDGKITRLLIKRGLAISLPIAGSGSRLIITEAGRAALAEAPDAAGPEGQPMIETTQSTGSDALAEQSVGAPTAATKAATEQEGDAPAPSDEAAASTRVSKPKKAAPSGKLGALVELLKRPDGATVEDMVAATGWQVHSVRGAMSGSLKKGFGFTISSEKTETGRVYKIAAGEAV